jgi:hypothetical protein
MFFRKPRKPARATHAATAENTRTAARDAGKEKARRNRRA